MKWNNLHPTQQAGVIELVILFGGMFLIFVLIFMASGCVTTDVKSDAPVRHIHIGKDSKI